MVTDDIDPDDVGPGLIAVFAAMFGLIAIVVGFIVSLLLPPVGAIILAIGAIALFGSPVIGGLAWIHDRRSASS